MAAREWAIFFCTRSGAILGNYSTFKSEESANKALDKMHERGEARTSRDGTVFLTGTSHTTLRVGRR